MYQIKIVEITAAELVPGIGFKLPRQRYFRICSQVLRFTKDEQRRLRPSVVGKILIFYDGCKQMVIDKSAIVQIQVTEWDRDILLEQKQIIPGLHPDLPF